MSNNSSPAVLSIITIISEFVSIILDGNNYRKEFHFLLSSKSFF